MNQVILLRQTLKPLLGCHGARLSFLALFVIALLRVKTVNLAELATGFGNQAKIKSNYKRLQRFFASFDLNYSLDFMFSTSRDHKAAKRFFKKVLKATPERQPRVINVDKNAAYPIAFEELKKDFSLMSVN